jgi:hypothetical protein
MQQMDQAIADQEDPPEFREQLDACITLRRELQIGALRRQIKGRVELPDNVSITRRFAAGHAEMISVRLKNGQRSVDHESTEQSQSLMKLEVERSTGLMRTQSYAGPQFCGRLYNGILISEAMKMMTGLRLRTGHQHQRTGQGYRD